MVQIGDLSEGMKVRIVEKWNPACHANPDGMMDRYLGTIMTVERICRSWCRMEEDSGRWVWNKHAIDCIVEDEGMKCVFDEEDFMSLLNR